MANNRITRTTGCYPRAEDADPDDGLEMRMTWSPKQGGPFELELRDDRAANHWTTIVDPSDLVWAQGYDVCVNLEPNENPRFMILGPRFASSERRYEVVLRKTTGEVILEILRPSPRDLVEGGGRSTPTVKTHSFLNSLFELEASLPGNETDLLGPLNFSLSSELVYSGYEYSSPGNSIEVISLGGDGIHWNLADVGGGYRDGSPVIYTNPSGGNEREVVANSLQSFLAICCRYGVDWCDNGWFTDPEERSPECQERESLLKSALDLPRPPSREELGKELVQLEMKYGALLQKPRFIET